MVSGFPIRRDFDEFVQRYGAISPGAHDVDELLASLLELVRTLATIRLALPGVESETLKALASVSSEAWWVEMIRAVL